MINGRFAEGDEFPFDPSANGWDAAGRLLAWLRRNSLRLSPRALTLTAMLRLLVADQFVHGIGGGQYDQVLDSLIARHFKKIEAAAVFDHDGHALFPGAVDIPRVCLRCLLQEWTSTWAAVRAGRSQARMDHADQSIAAAFGPAVAVVLRNARKIGRGVGTAIGKRMGAIFPTSRRAGAGRTVIFDRELFMRFNRATAYIFN